MDAVEGHDSRWALSGHYHWLLTDPRPLEPPRPMPGHLGLWNWESRDGEVRERGQGALVRGVLPDPRKPTAEPLTPLLAHVFEGIGCIQKSGTVVQANIEVRIAFVVRDENGLSARAYVKRHTSLPSRESKAMITFATAALPMVDRGELLGSSHSRRDPCCRPRRSRPATHTACHHRQLL